MLSIADASMMGQNVDAAILSVMREVSQAAKVYEASEQLRSVGVHVLGTVINGERTEATYRAYCPQRPDMSAAFPFAATSRYIRYLKVSARAKTMEDRFLAPGIAAC